MTKKFWILVAFAILLIGSGVFLSSGEWGAMVAQGKAGGFLLPVIGLSALVDSINPCAFSVLLLTIGFLFSLGAVKAKILKVGFSYILGIFAVYTLIGLGILRALTFFGAPHFITKLGALILIAFGVINLLNELFPSFPIRLKIPQAAHGRIAKLIEKGSVPFALLMGVLVGLYEFPCTGGPYLFVLGLLHDHTTLLQGAGYLLFYNLIFVLPLAIILLVGSDKVFLEKVQSWKRTNAKAMGYISSLAMIGIGLLIFFVFA